jgi:outer membrane protein assembly factor BamB
MITVSSGSANPIVWAVGAEGDNLLHGFNALTGATVYTGTTAMQGLHRFQTLIAADDRLYVGADNKIYAFTFTP